jgi:hypothetical protein
MTHADKLIASQYIVKQAYANYLGMGGNTYSPDPVIKGLATHNMGTNTSNMTTNHLANTPVLSAPRTTAIDPGAVSGSSLQDILKSRAVATKKDPKSMFQKYMGSAFDPNSRVDRNKLKLLQSLQDEGMNLEDVKGNQANIYKKMKGMKF